MSRTAKYPIYAFAVHCKQSQHPLNSVSCLPMFKHHSVFVQFLYVPGLEITTSLPGAYKIKLLCFPVVCIACHQRPLLPARPHSASSGISPPPRPQIWPGAEIEKLRPISDLIFLLTANRGDVGRGVATVVFDVAMGQLFGFTAWET